eukprot:Gb_18597 [translate_table: standard]
MAHSPSSQETPHEIFYVTQLLVEELRHQHQNAQEFQTTLVGNMMNMFRQILNTQTAPIAIPHNTPQFKLDTKISIPRFDDNLDANQLDAWLQSLEAYFQAQQITDIHKIMVTEVHMANPALTWWNAHVQQLQTNRQPPIRTWDRFKEALRTCFYPIG